MEKMLFDTMFNVLKTIQNPKPGSLKKKSLKILYINCNLIFVTVSDKLLQIPL